MEALAYPAIALVLFFIIFVTKKRFGLLGLALAAGSLISSSWQSSAGSIVSSLGLYLSPRSVVLISAILLLLPSAILLFHGHSYKTLISRLVGATLFTVLAMTLLVRIIGKIMPLNNLGPQLYAITVNNYDIVVGICLLIAVVDIFITKSHHSSSKHHKS